MNGNYNCIKLKWNITIKLKYYNMKKIIYKNNVKVTKCKCWLLMIYKKNKQ